MLGLSHYLAGHLAEAMPLLEETSALATDELDLAYIARAWPTSRRGSPTRARATWARAFDVARGLGGGPPASPHR